MPPTLRAAILARVPDDPRKTMQLYTVLQVSEGLPYEISININTEDGLTNGALGTVMKIQTPVHGKAKGVL